MNNKIFICLLLASFGFLFNACEDEVVEVLAGQEGLFPPNVSLIEDVSPCFDFNDLSAEAGFNVSIDEAERAEIETVDVYGTYLSGGVEKGPILITTLNSFPADYITNPAELLGPMGISESDLKLGDVFRFSFGVGSAKNTFLTANSQSIAISLPATIGGAYTVSTSGQSTDGCCTDPVNLEDVAVDIVNNGDGTYDITDITGGLWIAWYNVYGITDPVAGFFSESCNQIEIFGTTEPFGSNISGGGTVNPLNGVINISWTADSWGDVGSMTLTPVE